MTTARRAALAAATIRPAVGEGAQVMDMRQVGARNPEADRCSAGREKQRAVLMPSAVGEPDFASIGVNRRHMGAELQLDPVIRVKLGRAQRYPFLGCVAGEIVLRQIGPIVRPVIVRAQHRDRAGIALMPQHLDRGVSRGAAADDDDRFGRRLHGRPRLSRGRRELLADIDGFRQAARPANEGPGRVPEPATPLLCAG